RRVDVFDCCMAPGRQSVARALRPFVRFAFGRTAICAAEGLSVERESFGVRADYQDPFAIGTPELDLIVGYGEFPGRAHTVLGVRQSFCGCRPILEKIKDSLAHRAFL